MCSRYHHHSQVIFSRFSSPTLPLSLSLLLSLGLSDAASAIRNLSRVASMACHQLVRGVRIPIFSCQLLFHRIPIMRLQHTAQQELCHDLASAPIPSPRPTSGVQPSSRYCRTSSVYRPPSTPVFGLFLHLFDSCERLFLTIFSSGFPVQSKCRMDKASSPHFNVSAGRL